MAPRYAHTYSPSEEVVTSPPQGPTHVSLTSLHHPSRPAVTMFNYATGGTGFYVKSMLKSKYPYTAVSLCLVYQLVVTMILMNLLTGVMTNALTKARRSYCMYHHLSSWWLFYDIGKSIWGIRMLV